MEPERAFRTRNHKLIDAPHYIQPFLDTYGFANVVKLKDIVIDTSFIYALRERWRPETHTFHFPTGECTITLEDVSMLLGIRVNGRVVVGPSEISASAWTTFLARQPPENHIKGRRVCISWLKQILEETQISENTSHDELITYTRIYIILCISLTLFPDQSTKDVHSMWIPFVQDLCQCGEYSWGSVVLAYLYREICKAVDVDVDGMGGGGVILLQTWGFTRFPFIAPITYAVPSHPYASM